MSVEIDGFLMCSDDPVSLSNAVSGGTTAEDRFPGERTRSLEETVKLAAGVRISRPGGGRHSTSNQLSLRLLDILEWLGDRRGALDKS